MSRKIISLLLALSVCFSLASCSFVGGFGMTVPELASIVGFTKNYISAQVNCFDGKKMTAYYTRLRSDEDFEKLQKIIRQVTSRKGIKVNNFTADKITYPIYSLTVEPLVMGEDNEPGENVVWTNGYLLTDSGNVYKCDMDFTPIIEEERCFYTREIDRDNVKGLPEFRPLAMANRKWNTDYLLPVIFEYATVAPDVEAEVIDTYEENGARWVTLQFDNWGDKELHYAKTASIEIKVEGELYSIPRDPCLVSYTIGTMSFDNKAVEHSITTQDFCLGVYGDLPEGEYMISVMANRKSDYYFIFAPITIK